MPLSLTLCAQCTGRNPDFNCVIARLRREYAENLQVVELNCIAACEDGPSVMLEYDYFGHITADELYRLVQEHFARQKCVMSAARESGHGMHACQCGKRET